MNPIDAVFALLFLLMFAAILALAYERQNGHMSHMPPEPTVLRQLESCGHRLATAEQSVEVWRTLAEKRKVIIAELSAALQDCNNG